MDAFKREYLEERVSEWVKQIEILSDIAKSQPQCAYSAFVGGFVHKFTYHLRVLNDIEDYLIPLDNAIDQLFIPAITEGHRCSPIERRLLALPVRYGGLGIPILAETAKQEFENSLKVTNTLTENIVTQSKEYPGNNNKEKYAILKDRELKHKQTLTEIRAALSPEEK
eukprot:TCONS_00029546-protein